MYPTPPPRISGADRRALIFEFLDQQSRADAVAARLKAAARGRNDSDDFARLRARAERSWTVPAGRAPR